MPHQLTPIAVAVCLLGIHSAALAQQPPAAKAPKPAETPSAVTKVEVKGNAAQYDPRREDTASKTVLSNEEIIKYGDTNVYDVLKRAPGVTVIGNSIRMRGLGNGYTQILVNGERPPPGFSMDAVPPEQIEKIEVIRAATAEHFMQAIAGTINIVLKKLVAKPQRDLRVNTSYSAQQKNLFAIGTLADRSGSLSYYLNGTLNRNLGRTSSDNSEQFTLPDSQVIQLRDKHNRQSNDFSSLGLQPRLNWKLDNDGQFNLAGFVQASRYEHASTSATSNRIGSFASPDYTSREGAANSRSHFAGADVNWVTKLYGGKFDAKLAGSSGRSENGSRSLSSTSDKMPRLTQLQRDADNDSRYTNFSTTAKYTRSLFDGHALATGWEASSQESEDNSLRVDGVLGVPSVRVREVFNPVVRKMAVYVQDEWNLTKDWSMYQGLRWESIRTDSSGTGLLDTQSRNSVLSPVAQTLYKFPDKSGRQLRLALTRTFKAPATNQLSARRYASDLNTRFSPDYTGNPELRPELATGIDLTYEHFFAPGAVFSVGTSQRSITDYIRNKLVEDSSGYWTVLPLNDGSARVRTLDVELKFPLKAVIGDAPAFDLRANVNRNWSKVNSVPGPDNRLDQQVPLSVVLGADYREDKFSAGASVAYRAGGPVRVSEQQTTRLQQRRELEAYLLYKIRTGLQLRLAVNNALGEDNLNDSSYQDSNGTSRTWGSAPASARLQANLEMKF